MAGNAPSDPLPPQSNGNAAQGEPNVSPLPTDQANVRTLPSVSGRLDHLARGHEGIREAQDSSSGPEEFPKLIEKPPMGQEEVHADKISSVAVSPADHGRFSSSPPELPSRNHLAYSSLITSPYPAVSRSNRSIIRFVRTLSRWFLYGGTLSGIIALLYQRYIFPSLEARTRALVALTAVGLTSHTALVNRLLALQRSFSVLLTTPAKQARELDSSSTSDAKGTTQDDKSSTLMSGEQLLPTHPTSLAFLNNDGNTIRRSLHRLADSLRQRQLSKSHTPSGDGEIVPTAFPISAPRNLSRALERLREDISLINMSYPAKHGFFGPSLYANALNVVPNHLDNFQRPPTLDKYLKAVSDLKGELRSLKGMLLNRRNFASRSAT